MPPEEAARLIQERGFRRVYTWPQTPLEKTRAALATLVDRPE